MYRRSVNLVPRLSRLFDEVPKQQVRMIWDLTRPANEFRSIMREMDRRMEEMERDMIKWSPLRHIAPRVVRIDGVQSGNNEYTLDLDVSGYKPEEIKVSLNGGKLRIEAEMERTDNNGNVKKRLLYQEFVIPPNLEISTLQSLLGNDGVMRITGHLKPGVSDGKEIPIEGVKDKEEKPTVT